MRAETEAIDLGHGFTGELRRIDGELLGIDITGPCGANCRGPKQKNGRCSGWVPINDGDRGWELVSESPLTLKPSIRCGCDVDQAGTGQHGFITDGRWVNSNGIVDA